VEYPLVAQLGPDIPISIVGRNPEGNWYQICCVGGGSAWVAVRNITTIHDPSEVPLVVSDPPPTPTGQNLALQTMIF